MVLIKTELAAMSPEDDNYKKVLSKIDALANHLVNKFIANNNVVRAAYQAKAGTGGNNTNDLNTALTWAFTSINGTSGSTTNWSNTSQFETTPGKHGVVPLHSEGLGKVLETQLIIIELSFYKQVRKGNECQKRIALKQK
jgi:hypothetical protein